MKTHVIRPGVVETGRRIKGGFNLNKFVKELLQSMGFAATVDCCTYYPTYPVLEVASASDPTEQEMVNVPLYSMFLTLDGNYYYLHFKYEASNTDVISTNIP